MPDLLTEITHATRAYYQQLQHITCTEADYQDWLRELPTAEREHTAARGFALACVQRTFQRYCLEWRGYSMREFMRARLSVAAFDLWQANYEFNGDLLDEAEAR